MLADYAGDSINNERMDLNGMSVIEILDRYLEVEPIRPQALPGRGIILCVQGKAGDCPDRI